MQRQRSPSLNLSERRTPTEPFRVADFMQAVQAEGDWLQEKWARRPSFLKVLVIS